MTDSGGIGPHPDRVSTFVELRAELQRLRVTAARGRGKARLSLQDIAAVSGIPKSSLANYLSGATLMPADQLDAVVLAMGATPGEAAAWARAWDRSMDRHLEEARSAPAGLPAEPERAGSTPPSEAPARLPATPARLPATPARLPATPARRSRKNTPGFVRIPGVFFLDRRGTANQRRLSGFAVTGVLVVAACFGGLAGDQYPRPRPAAVTAEPATPLGTRWRCVPVAGNWPPAPGTGHAPALPGLACKDGANLAWTIATAGSPTPPAPVGGYGNADWCLPVVGDWDGDGASSIGVTCGGGPEHVLRWSLINGFAGSPSYPRFDFGDSNRCWPVTGDWDGDGTTTPGTACAENHTIVWRLANANRAGAPAYPPFAFGDADTCVPVTGDWDGNATTTVGVACRGERHLLWRLTNTLGDQAPIQFTYGDRDRCRPVTGDWDADGDTTVGVVCRENQDLTWNLSDVNTAGGGTRRFTFGRTTTYRTNAGWPGPGWPPPGPL